MGSCKDCVHYGICEYSTIIDKEIQCKDFFNKANYVEVDGDATLLIEKKPKAIWVGTSDSPIEYVPVVRCKDCKLWDDWHDAFDRGTCNNPHFNFHHSRNSDRCWHPLTESNWFCSYGERK